MEFAVCSKCKQSKRLDDFHRGKNSNGRRSDCKECHNPVARAHRKKAYRENPDYHKAKGKQWYEKNKDKVLQYKKQYQKENAAKIRAYNRKFKNGIYLSAEDEQKMIDSQGNLCAICNRPPKENKTLVVDHNHTTGRIRKLLCGNCNVMVGMSNEDITTLQKAVNYLQSFIET